MRPHRQQPTRLPHPWDSPGKNTGVGCHFLLQCMKVKSESEVTQSCPTQRPHGLQPTKLLRPWDFPGKSTGVGCHCLLPPFCRKLCKLCSQSLVRHFSHDFPHMRGARGHFYHTEHTAGRWPSAPCSQGNRSEPLCQSDLVVSSYILQKLT